jgi:hypothetical protein
MPTITGKTSGNLTTPTLILKSRTSQAAANQLQEIIGSSEPWISLAAARSREGEIVAVYESAGDAENARTLLTGAEAFELDYPDIPSLSMSFAVVGAGVQTQQVSLSMWTITAEFREIAP